jgi:hypothetical protein
MPTPTHLQANPKRDWLVVSRNKIQQLLLAQESHAKGTTEDELRRWQLALGAAFSLWRAVFLAWQDDLARTFDVTKPDSLAYLRKVIDTNAIAFSDDVTARHWASGYYLNNARYRLERLLGEGTLPTVIDRRARDVWDEYFDWLAHTVGQFGR